MEGLIVVKNLNLGMKEHRERKLSKESSLVGISGEHRLDLGRIGRWLKSILRIGGGRIESLQRRLLGLRRMSSWRVRGRNVDRGCLWSRPILLCHLPWCSIELVGQYILYQRM